MPDNITDWISAIANAIVAIGLLLVWTQVRIAAKGLAVAQHSLATLVQQVELQRASTDQMIEQVKLAKASHVELHEMERRKLAIQLIREWVEFLHRCGTGAKAFAETLDYERTKLLWQEKELEIPLHLKTYLEKTVPAVGTIKTVNDTTARLSESQSSLIRREAVSYLNTIETVLAARRHGVADADMIGEQFANLVAPADGKQLLHTLRNIAGGVHAFPSIDEFVREIESTKGKVARKPKLGNAA